MVSNENLKKEEINTEIVIIGGGGGGLTAATAAAEKGAKVLMLEKRDVLGGNTVRGGGPPARDSLQEKGFKAMGVETLLEIRAKKLITTQDGSVKGVLAEGKEGRAVY